MCSIVLPLSSPPQPSPPFDSQGLVSEALAPSAAAAPLPYPPCAGPPSASASVDSQALVATPHVMEKIERVERKMQVRVQPEKEGEVGNGVI